MKISSTSKLIWISILTLVIGCQEAVQPPEIIVGEAKAYARLITLINGDFDFNDKSNTAFAYEVEFVSEEDGEDVAVYEVQVSFNDGESQVLASFGQSDFFTNDNGHRGIEVSFSLTEVAGLLEIDPANVIPGDLFTFNGFVELDNGNRYGHEDFPASFGGSLFEGFLRKVVNVICPLTETQYVGLYSVDYVGVGTDVAPNCLEPDKATLTDDIPDMTLGLVEGFNSLRTITPEGGSIPWALESFSYNGLSIIQILCDQLSMTGKFELNGSCGSGIELTGGEATVISLDYNDDQSFVLEVKEFANGDCDCPEITFQLQFTKQ